MLIKPLLKLMSRQSAGKTCYLAPVAHHHQGWNRANLKLRGRAWIGFGVELYKARPGTEYPRHLGKHRRKLLARTAPRRPEIHYHRQVGPPGIAGEVIVRCRNWPPVQKLRLAFSAHRRVAELMLWHTVNGRAGRAYQVK